MLPESLARILLDRTPFMNLCTTTRQSQPDPIITGSQTLHPLWTAKLSEGYSVSLFDSVRETKDVWDSMTYSESFFFRSRYLESVESNPPKGFVFGYLVFFRNQSPVGIAYCQWIRFSGREHLDLSSLAAWKRFILKRISISILVCGNMMRTGPNAFAFDATVEEDKQAMLLREGLDKLICERNLGHRQAAMWVLKDVPSEQFGIFDALHSCTGFDIQPSMELDLPADWQSFDDYLASMTSKYRVRAKRAFKKMAGIERLPLNESRSEVFAEDLHRLYREVANHSGFNMVALPDDYFASMAYELGASFRATAFTRNGEIVGFYTLIQSDSRSLEAHYLGFQGKENRDSQLYLNMLYDIIRTGIDMKVSHINLSRTALEIKSSVGATPRDYRLYTRHRCRILNALFPIYFQRFVPEAHWEARHPFGKESA